MRLNDEDFERWMEKLLSKINEIGKDLKSLINTKEVFDDNDKLLDNQDLCFLLNASVRSIQRHRSSGSLPYIKIRGKVYYFASAVQAFVKEHCDVQTLKNYEQSIQKEEEKQKNKKK